MLPELVRHPGRGAGWIIDLDPLALEKMYGLRAPFSEPYDFLLRDEIDTYRRLRFDPSGSINLSFRGGIPWDGPHRSELFLINGNFNFPVGEG